MIEDQKQTYPVGYAIIRNEMKSIFLSSSINGESILVGEDGAEKEAGNA